MLAHKHSATRHIAAILALLLIATTESAFAQTPTLVQIEDAWKSRQNNMQSVSFKWDSIHVVPAGAYNHRDLKGRSHTVPETSATMKRQTELLLCGNRSRLTIRGEQFRIGISRIIDATTVFGTDGSKAWHIDFPSQARGDYPFCMQFKDPGNVGVTAMCLPIKMTCRTHDDSFLMPLHLSDFQIRESGPSLTLVSEKNLPQRETLTLGNRPGYPMLTYRVESDGRKLVEVECSYSAPNVLTGWKYLYYFSSGALSEQAQATSVVSELGKCDDLQVFAPNFPKDALVNDIDKDEYYILNADGSKRLVLPNEQQFGIDYAELRATTSGGAGKTTFSFLNTLFYSICALVAIAFAYYGIKRFFVPPKS
ncbi:MAG: hypothetical protein ACR2FY_25255 [Pirellulaceae bacterium]